MRPSIAPDWSVWVNFVNSGLTVLVRFALSAQVQPTEHPKQEAQLTPLAERRMPKSVRS